MEKQEVFGSQTSATGYFQVKNFIVNLEVVVILSTAFNSVFP